MNTSHRKASHAKRSTRATLPKFWRPKLDADQVVSCKVAHWDLLARFTSGNATEHDLWDFVHTGLTYSELMRLLEEDGTPFTEEAKAAITEHLETFAGVINRFRTTGRIGFNSEQLLAARAAAEVMDQLIEMDRFGFAVRATEWAMVQTNGMRFALPNTECKRPAQGTEAGPV